METLPKAGEEVLVTTETFRCIASLDREGVWRYANGKPIEAKVLSWSRFEI